VGLICHVGTKEKSKISSITRRMRRRGGHGLFPVLVRAVTTSTTSTTTRTRTTIAAAAAAAAAATASSFSSSSSLEDAALIWARQNPVAAQSCLEPPPFLLLDDDPPLMPFGTLEEYWSYRQWGLNTDHEKALVSHVLSAPLTAFHLFLSSNDDDSFSVSQQRVCFVGARAEASLPVQYWRELLGLIVATGANNNNDNTNSHHEQHGKTQPRRRRHYQLHFTGPELVRHPNVSLFLPPTTTTTITKQHTTSSSSTTTTMSSSSSSSSLTPTMTLQWHAPCLFHNWKMATTVLFDPPDAFFDALICLNPGFGHPHLRDCWRPSLPWIFPQSQSLPPHSRRSPPPPVLVTAHSAVDAKRDAQWLRDEWGVDITYQRNPFASRLRYHDPFSTTNNIGDNTNNTDDSLVQPNLFYGIYYRP
jgi:hypothetical protein